MGDACVCALAFLRLLCRALTPSGYVDMCYCATDVLNVSCALYCMCVHYHGTHHRTTTSQVDASNAELVGSVRRLLHKSLDSVWSRSYDEFQRVSNGIAP